MTEHEDAAAGAERELADLEERTETLGEEIAEARKELVDAADEREAGSPPPGRA